MFIGRTINLLPQRHGKTKYLGIGLLLSSKGNAEEERNCYSTTTAAVLITDCLGTFIGSQSCFTVANNDNAILLLFPQIMYCNHNSRRVLSLFLRLFVQEE